MVARSFQNFDIVSDIFTVNNRAYVTVKNPKTGTTRNVRWYEEKEYNKLYNNNNNLVFSTVTNKPQKEALGFTNGFITIFKGDTYKHIDWFREKSACRYTRIWGWYVVSTDTVPSDIPEGITTIQLPWTLVGNEDGTLRNEEEVKRTVETLLIDPSPSQFYGTLGERLDLTLTVKKTINFDMSRFGGLTILHIMEDAMQNVFVWITSSKNLTVNKTYHMRGTVKEHRVYRNCNQTVLTNCRMISE